MTISTQDSPLTESEQLRRDLVAEKHAQAKRLLQEHGIDCWLTFVREGSDLLLPFAMGGEYLVGTSALMVFAEGPTVAIVADYDRTQVDGSFDIVHAYSGDWREPFHAVLTERRPSSIAINYSEDDYGVDGLTYGLYLLLRRTLEPMGLADALVSAEPIAAALRAHKTETERERIRRACEITIRIFDDVTAMLRPGITELDVQEFINERMTTYEVEPAWEAVYCPSVVAGDREAGHTAPTNNVIEAGTTVRIDFGVKYEGYCSDLQRTWYLRKDGETEAPDDIQHRFAAVRDGVQLAVELVKPGVIGWDVDAPVRNLIKERGYTFTHALGHQLGRMVHDGGVLLGPDNARYGSRSNTALAEGMVFTIEPCIHLAQLEEDVVVTADGCEYLVPPQRTLILV